MKIWKCLMMGIGVSFFMMNSLADYSLTNCTPSLQTNPPKTTADFCQCIGQNTYNGCVNTTRSPGACKSIQRDVLRIQTTGGINHACNAYPRPPGVSVGDCEHQLAIFINGIPGSYVNCPWQNCQNEPAGCNWTPA